MSLTKNEVVKMARECNLMDGLIPVQSQLERFATLCRAPLVEEVERLEQWHAEMADNRNAIASERDTLKAELARVRAGKPVAWLVTGPYEKRAFDMRGFAEAYCSGLNKGAGENIYKVSDLVMSIGEHEKCTDERMCIACFSGQGKCENPTPPQPTAQEPTSAVKVVREMVEALNGIDQGIDLSKYPYAPDDITLLDITQAALEAGQQFLKEQS